MKHWTALGLSILAIAFAFGCASVDKSATEGGNMANDTMKTKSSTASADMNAGDEAADMEKAAEEGADDAADEMD